MPNPILPLWEYVPDGEPRVFGDRVYLYGSHDTPASTDFCDYKLKVWSAALSNLNCWQCHGDSFHTREDRDHGSDTAAWTRERHFAPDVVCKDGKYYLFSYIFNSKGCVSVSDTPEGPFRLLGQYQYDPADAGDAGVFNDPSVLIDDDGRAYLYYGYLRSFSNELDPSDLTRVLAGSLQCDPLPAGEGAADYFEASSLRKINGLYYYIYSPRCGSRLDYAISEHPRGPFRRMGTIIDNAQDYPGGNNHGSLCCLNGQWYIFYHRMTNCTVMSRRACVERVEILSDGTIPQVEMTSLGFEDVLNPYQITPAEIACVLKQGCFITEKNALTRVITGIRSGAVIGYKYFDFGADYSSETMLLFMKITGCGCRSTVRVCIDREDGEELGLCEIDTYDGIYRATLKAVTGRHSVFFEITHGYTGWFANAFKDRNLFELESFTFMK